MAAATITREEKFGLALAALGHVALVWVLVTAKPPEALPPIERVSVTLSDEVGAVSTSPNPQSDPMADKGPELGEPAPEPEPVEAVQPEPAPQPKAAPVPPPRPVPATKTPSKPPQQAQKPPSKWPFAPPQQAQKPLAKAPPSKTPPAKPGTSSFDQAFSKGIPGGNPKGKDKTPPAQQASAQQVASWTSLIGTKVRGPWNSCPVSGLDVGKLRASVRFTLDKSGRVMAIEPFDVTGVTDANRSQVKPFRDCAIRAIKLAAPFTGLPAEFYDQWKSRKLNFSKQ